MELIIKELKNINEILLCKINKSVIAQIDVNLITSQSRSIDDIDTIELTINDTYLSPHTMKYKKNPYYNDVVEERFLCVDGEYYVIKEVTEDTDGKNNCNTKKIKAYGHEKKLEKINISLSNTSISLLDKDDKVQSFNDILYSQTGWKLGYVAYDVRYMDNGEPKVRIQEQTDTSFYNFITETIRDQFCCIPIFNRINKTIDLYNDYEFGDELKIVLSNDNYIKSLTKTSNSNDIVTRLKLKGNENKCIVKNETITGDDFIENYSYFIQTKEMSEELINAINLFTKLTPDRLKEWEELVKNKNELSTSLDTKNSQEDICQAKIKQLQALIDEYTNMETDTLGYNVDGYKSQLLGLVDESDNLNTEISKIETTLEKTNKRIDEINILCRRETATDLKGNLIFPPELLDEFKEFTYYDTYSDDSFVDAKELIKTGERELERRCKPTIEFSIDTVNFLDRIITNKYYRQWKGQIGLGDVISLYDTNKDIEQFVYFVGWQKDYTTKTIKLSFSNKKTKSNNSKTISDLLKNAQNNKKVINSNKWLWNNQKYNRIDNNFTNQDFDFGLPVTFTKKAVTGVKVNTHFLNLNVNENYLAQIEIQPEDATNKEVIWASSDKSVATVDGNGLIVGVKRGICSIGVVTKDGNFTDSIAVNVGGYITENIQVTGLQAVNSKMTLAINEQFYLVSIASPDNATNKTVSYNSSDETIASVSSAGLVTGLKAGICTITMTSLSNTKVQASCIITVSDSEADKVIVSTDNSLIIGEGRIKQLYDLNYLSRATVECAEDVTPSYFYTTNNVISKYENKNFSCIIIMFGKTDPTASGISQMKLLIEKLKNTFKVKDVFVIQELPLGINYDKTLGTYSIINEQIDLYNKTISSYCQGIGAVSIDCSSILTTNELLNIEYTNDGYKLNDNGAKIFFNNINQGVDDYEKILVQDALIKKQEEERKKQEEEQKQKEEDEANKTDKNSIQYCTASSLNVRKGGSTSFDIIGTLSYGDKVTVISTYNGWAKINYKNGIGYVSEKYITPSNPNQSTSTDGLCNVREKIVARAEDIYNLCKQGKAWYSQYCRTVDYNNKVKITTHSEMGYKQPGYGKWGFDCSSTVGCCYQNAGFNFMKGLSCSSGSLQSMAKKHNAMMWRYTGASSVSKAKPGDIVMFANHSVSSSTNLATVSTHHTAIYIGNGYIIEASGYSRGILKRQRNFDSTTFFMRIQELTKADEASKNNNSSNASSSTSNDGTSVKEGTNCYRESGTKDGNKYIYKFTKARCTAYGGNASASASGTRMTAGKSCAGHNMPYGTRIYIPALKGRFGNSSGIFTVHDTGGYIFDFDLYLSSSDAGAGRLFGEGYYDVYVLSWGSGRCASSYTDMVKVCNKYYGVGAFHSAWVKYMKNGGVTINFFKFNSDDKNIKNQSWYKRL